MQTIGAVAGRVLDSIGCEGLTEEQRRDVLSCEESWIRAGFTGDKLRGMVERQVERHRGQGPSQGWPKQAGSATPAADELIKETTSPKAAETPAANKARQDLRLVHDGILDSPEYLALSPEARLLLTTSIMRHVNRKKRSTFITWDTMKHETGLDKAKNGDRRFREALKELEAAGAITRTKKRPYRDGVLCKSQVTTVLLWGWDRNEAKGDKPKQRGQDEPILQRSSPEFVKPAGGWESYNQRR